MPKKSNIGDMPRGGFRENSGRPSLPKSKKRANNTVKMLPATTAELKRLSRAAGTSQGHAIEWFALSPDAKPAREKYADHGAEFDGSPS